MNVNAAAVNVSRVQSLDTNLRIRPYVKCSDKQANQYDGFQSKTCSQLFRTCCKMFPLKWNGLSGEVMGHYWQHLPLLLPLGEGRIIQHFCTAPAAASPTGTKLLLNGSLLSSLPQSVLPLKPGRHFSQQFFLEQPISFLLNQFSPIDVFTNGFP